jgi:hypothetical protein
MRRIACLLALLLCADRPAAACTFCGGGPASRQTLREHFRQAKYVAHGKLKNPKFDPNGGGGTTEFHVEKVLKADPAIGNRAVLILPKYLPVIGDTPPDYLIFCAVVDGKPDPVHGIPVAAGVVDYLLGATKQDKQDVAKRLGYFFARLDAADTAIAADAFVEFAKASDAELVKARAVLDPAKLRKLLAARDTPSERIGVFALMLGLCGTKTDAELFAKLLDAQPPPERVRENLGGFLAALTLLNADAGWAHTQAILTDPKRPFDQRLAAVGTVRFFQTTRPADAKPWVLKCYRGLLAHGDLADVAMDDLRRWGWWDLTAEVLKQFNQPTHAAPVVRRGIVRYALCCPRAEAKRFLADVRASDPKLVARVEETLNLYK